MARKQKTEKELLVSSSAPLAAPRHKATATRKKHAITQAELSSAPAVEPSVSHPTSAPRHEPLAGSSPNPKSTAVPAPTYEEISLLAYSYWEARGCQGGCPDEDWRRAEEELLARALATTA